MVSIKTRDQINDLLFLFSAGMYHPDGYMHSSHSTSTSGQVPPMQYHPPNVGIPPYGYDSSMFHEKPIDGKLNFHCYDLKMK